MSGVFQELERRQNRFVWLLEIDGLEETYFSGPKVPVLPPYTEPWTHTPQGGIINVTSASQELGIADSVASAGQVAVTISITRTNNASQFMAVGRSGAPLTATLSTTLDQSSSGFLVVNEDISAWPATGELWIGKECITYTARTVVAPFRFTIPVPSARGWWGSEQRQHVAAPLDGWSPRVYSQCVTWQNRKARVLVSSLRDDGTTSDGWVEYVSGRIVANPEISDDGLELSINIIPHTDSLNIEVGGGQFRTGLQQGLHTFDGKSADTFSCKIGWADGQAFNERVTSTALVATELPIRWENHINTFDIGGGDPNRTGRIYEAGAIGVAYQPTAYLGAPYGAGPGDKLTIAPGTPGVSIVGQTFRNVEQFDFVSATVLAAPETAEVIQWPDEAIDRLSDRLSPGNHITVGLVIGQFADVSFDPNSDNGPIINLSFNARAKNPATATFFPWDEGSERLYYGISTFNPEDGTTVWGLETIQHERVGSRLTREIAVGNGAPWAFTSAQTFSGRPAIERVTIRGYADAFYQRGEEFIHVIDDLFSTTGSVIIRWTEWDGEEYRQSIRLKGTRDASTITPGSPGTLLEVDLDVIRTLKSFGDWPGKARCTIEQDVSWWDEEPGTILLNVLMSGEGDGFNSSFDIFSNGANLTAEEVDADSFLRYPYPEGLARALTLSLNDFESVTIREFIEPILKIIGGAIVLRLEQVSSPGAGGVLRRRLALEPVGSEYDRDSLGSIANGDWHERGRPSTTDDNKIVNMVRLKMQYDSEDDEFQLIVNVSDRDSIGEYGPAAVEELDMRGVKMNPSSVSDQTQQLVPFSAHRFASLGAPRRQVEGVISWSDAVKLNAGAVVLVTADEVYGYDKVRGVSALPMRIVSISGDGYTQQARIKLTWHDATVSGWAPSLEVTAVGAADTYTVATDQFTETTDPIAQTALDDIDFWNVGDSIRACPLGDFGNSTGGLTVLSIAGNVITLSAPAAPALVVGDTLRPDSYAAVATTDEQKRFAFLADDSGGLGAAPDKPKEYG